MYNLFTDELSSISLRGPMYPPVIKHSKWKHHPLIGDIIHWLMILWIYIYIIFIYIYTYIYTYIYIHIYTYIYIYIHIHIYIYMCVCVCVSLSLYYIYISIYFPAIFSSMDFQDYQPLQVLQSFFPWAPLSDYQDDTGTTIFNIAMGNGPFMDDFPTKTSIYFRDFPWLCWITRG